MSDYFLGQIALFPYNFAPLNWAQCQGQLLPISQYTALFSLIGTYYGGNGISNFALPDLRGRVAIGQGSGAGLQTYDMGETGGAEAVTLQTAQMAAHTHSLQAVEKTGSADTPPGNLLAAPIAGRPPQGNAGKIYNVGTPDTQLSPTAVAPAGSGQAHNNVQPSLVLTYCILITSGVFPPRG